MKTIFQNKELQKQFDSDGYVLAPWLSAEEVAKLRNTYAGLDLSAISHFHSTSFLPDTEVKKKINADVEAVFGNKVDSTFAHIKKLGSSFLTKPSGQNGIMPVHQDWTIVDEAKYCSVTIWVALEDINEQNGAMQVLPGSHKFSPTLRAPTLDTEYSQLQDYLRSKLTTINMKAGEAIIFNHALFHASLMNSTGQPRLAVTYGLIPEEAQLSLCLRNAEGTLEQFEMPDDMFLHYDTIGSKPLFGEKIRDVEFTLAPKSQLFFETKINQYMASVKGERIFKNPDHQQSFDRDGYVVLPALGQGEVSELLAFYQSLQLTDKAGFGFHISMDQEDKSLVGKILDKLMEVAFPKMSVHFDNSKAFVGSFVIKEPNPTGVVPVHQDWTFVDDEERHSSLTCWVPLVDVGLDNGAMAVIKGSHRFFKNFRPSPSPQVPSPLSEHMFTIFPYLQLIEMKAGEMLVFDNRTFHGSPPNTTDTTRVAFGIGMTQKDAKLVHCYLNPGEPAKNEVFKYNITENFFRKYENSTLAKMYDKGETIEGFELNATLPYTLPQFTSEELIDLIQQHGNTFNEPMCERLAELFNKYNAPQPEPEVHIPEPEPIQVIEEKPWVWVDNRSFTEKYSPKNIITEIKKMLTA